MSNAFSMSNEIIPIDFPSSRAICETVQILISWCRVLLLKSKLDLWKWIFKLVSLNLIRRGVIWSLPGLLLCFSLRISSRTSLNVITGGDSQFGVFKNLFTLWSRAWVKRWCEFSKGFWWDLAKCWDSAHGFSLSFFSIFSFHPDLGCWLSSHCSAL